MLCRVAKLGGSLLDLPDVASRLQAWLASQVPAQTLLIVGGGDFVEAVRSLDRIHDFDAQWCHWFCVQLMEQTATIAQRLMPDLAHINSRGELSDFVDRRGSEASLTLVRVAAFYDQSAKGGVLPQTWETTSDSIAALLAHRIGAGELVLLKSTGPASATGSILDWQHAGLVDKAFCAAAEELPCVRLVNLRASLGILPGGMAP